MKQVSIYTDGACSGNPGPGGWGAILIYKENRRELSGGEAETEEERPVAAQQAANQRLLERLIGLDRRLNEMLCKERSIYKTGRQA